jgi:hypothetical protein
MKIKNKFFLTILKKTLTKSKKDLEIVDGFLYYHGITDYDGFHKDIEKYEKIENELKINYPEVYDNLIKCWELVRSSSLLLDELLDGIE